MKLDDDLCAHYLNLDFSENFLADDETQIRTQLPYPIHKPFRDSRIDIIDKFNDDLEKYNDQLRTARKEFQFGKNKILEQKFTNSYATITRGLLNFCNGEKYETPFPCDYNPFYASGFLEFLNLNNTDYLVRPDCKNNLRVTNIIKPWKSTKMKFENRFEEPITGVFSHNEHILLKHKKEANLIRIADLSDVAQIKWRKKFKMEVLDAKFNNTKIGFVLSDTKFRLYDIESSKKDDLPSVDSATRLDFIGDSAAILGQKNLKIIDLRSGDYKLFQPELTPCNYLCSMRICDNLVYLATRHHLIRTDVRFLKKEEFCTHLMKFSPCYVDLVGDFLCLGGQKVEEKVLFSGNPINSLPMGVPSLCDSLQKCQMKEDFLLRGEIGQRVKRSVGGIKLFAKNDDVFLYSANSLGDIFAQKITNTSQTDDDEALELLSHWIKKLPDSPKPLHLTNVANLSDARLALNKRVQTEHLTKFTRKTKKANYFLNHFKNVYHKNNLGELAANFVAIWEDEEEEREDVDLVPEVAPLDKVSDWIESSYFFD